MTKTTINKYLALYLGPCGPISRVYLAESDDAALELILEHGSPWYDEAADDLHLGDLDLDPESCTLDDLAPWLAGWQIVQLPRHVCDYALYRFDTTYEIDGTHGPSAEETGTETR